MESAIQQINGRSLLSGHISQSTGDSILEFTDHLVLKTFVTTSQEDARWHFRHKDADYVALGPMLVPSGDVDLRGKPSGDDEPEPAWNKAEGSGWRLRFWISSPRCLEAAF